MKNSKITVQGTELMFFKQNDEDYISLTDIAKFKNPDKTGIIISNWISRKYSIEFMGVWEKFHNKDFNVIEFDNIKNESGSNAFILSSKKWIESTNSIGIRSKSGRYGGTFAHTDIAFEFASWISPEFKLYLIKEFQRLKKEETEKKLLGWDAKRTLAKVNYIVHTDAVKEHLIPINISKFQISNIYANEADVLNIALFGKTAREWKDKNPEKEGNMRDYADVSQLVCLAGLESLNAEFIRQELEQKDRLQRLNEIAIIQMKSLLQNSPMKKLDSKDLTK